MNVLNKMHGGITNIQCPLAWIVDVKNMAMCDLLVHGQVKKLPDR